MNNTDSNLDKIDASQVEISPVSEFYCENLMEFGKRLPSFYTNIDFLKKDLQDPMKCFYIALYDDMPIGFVSFFKVFDEVHLAYIYVEEGFRNIGLGSRLFKYAVENFFLNGKEMWLEVESTNILACAFYTKLGFRIIYKRKNYYGEHKDAWIMKREP
jgi:ribosomal-protein-alanine N-acetyltransferase